MVVDGTPTTGEEFPCRIHPAAGFRPGFLAVAPSTSKFFAVGRGAARRLLFCPPLVGFGSVSSFQIIRTSQGGAASERVGLNQHGRGRGRAFGFGCLRTTPTLPVQPMRTGFDSAPFFFWLGPPDSSGRGFCVQFSGLCGTRWSVAGVGSNQHRG
jgi:hypothetical protein